MSAHDIIERPLHGEADFWRIRALLIETYPLTLPGFNWEVRNWEGKRLYDETPGWEREWKAAGRVWETAGGQLIGAIHPDSPGFACLQLHPDHREHLEATMIGRAEETIAVPARDNTDGTRLRFYVFEYDTARQELLAARGYRKLSAGGVIRRLHFGRAPLQERRPLPDGYTLRCTRPGEEEDATQIALLLNAAFNRDFHSAAEYLTFSRLAPSFRHDLDLVAVAPDGTFAAYIGIPYVAEIGHGLFEPVCTHPQHRRRGLARALMVEGLHRLQALGARDVVVETGDMIPANRLYEAIGFEETYRGYVWERVMERGLA